MHDQGCLLKDISFSLSGCSWLSIIGPNGAGKSTLLKAMTGILSLDSGSLHADELRIDTVSQRQRARLLAYVPQRFEALQPFLVREFLELALFALSPADRESRVAEGLSLFRLEPFADRSIQQLSVGELQRVQLAAAFVQGSDLLLLDEPSAALDPHEEVQMLLTLKQLAAQGKRSVILVSHNLSAALTFSDQVLLLEKGAARFCGSPEALIASGELESVFRQKFTVERREGKIYLLADYPFSPGASQ